MCARAVGIVCAVLAAAAGLAGCVAVPVPARGPGYGGYGGPPPVYDSYGYTTIEVAPPPPRVEVITPAPALGWLWIGGFWTWRANQHVWVGGHWEAPRPGYRWVPHAWEPVGQAWRERPGRWDPR